MEPTSRFLLEARDNASDLIGRELTDTEWGAAYPPARQKLAHIIQHYGDADGGRRDPWYLGKLVQEHLAATALTAFCAAKSAEKKTASEESGLTTPIVYHPSTANVNPGRSLIYEN